MAFKAVIGEDAAQIGVAREQHAVQIEHFAFEPACVGPEPGNRRHGGRLAGRNLHHQAVIFGDGEQHVNHLEPLGPLGEIDARDFHQLLVFVIVPQRPQHVFHRIALHGEDQLPMGFMRAEQHCAKRGRSGFRYPIVGGEFRS